MGGIIGALIVGLMLVIFLLINNNKSNGPVLAQPSGTPQATTAAADTPPRMPLDQFKALYDDPAKRPMIIDVRALASYDEGHIAGAISFPEADVDTRINEIPKDKLVIAYCQ
jgi:3-mercaptopyruvate sulfurtransferase SseA